MGCDVSSGCGHGEITMAIVYRRGSEAGVLGFKVYFNADICGILVGVLKGVGFLEPSCHYGFVPWPCRPT